MTPTRQNWYAEIAVAILVVALIILSAFLVRQYRITARQAAVSSERSQFASLMRRHQLGAADAGLIESWMTFDYVSVSFKVPDAQLAAALGISSSTAGYPNITLGRYARMAATSSQAVIDETRAAVVGYLAPAVDR